MIIKNGFARGEDGRWMNLSECVGLGVISHEDEWQLIGEYHTPNGLYSKCIFSRGKDEKPLQDELDEAMGLK